MLWEWFQKKVGLENVRRALEWIEILWEFRHIWAYTVSTVLTAKRLGIAHVFSSATEEIETPVPEAPSEAPLPPLLQ